MERDVRRATSTAPVLAAGQAAPAADVQARTSGRLLFVDNVRVFLTIMVLLHHTMIIYAGTGSWLYNEGREDLITFGIGSWFCTVNQAYFMGLFLLISAYFVPGAYDRKGAGRFLKDRLIRLGIPLLVYGWLVRPLLLYAGTAVVEGQAQPFWDWFPGPYFRDYGVIGGGPLWFIETLLLFSIVYALWRLLTGSRPARPDVVRPFPGSGAIVLFALLVGVVTFAVRLVFPVDSSFRPLNLQFANFTQYVALFVAGLLAYRRNWLRGMPDAVGRRWLVVAVLLVLSFPPLALTIGAGGNDALFRGGWHWQALASSVWESFLCLSMCIGVIYAFRRHGDHQGRLAHSLSRSAYGAYLVQEPMITLPALAMAGATLYPLLKFVVLSLVVVPLCFVTGSLLRRLPYADRVL